MGMHTQQLSHAMHDCLSSWALLDERAVQCNSILHAVACLLWLCVPAALLLCLCVCVYYPPLFPSSRPSGPLISL
jgi:hypothetical protein